MSVVWCGAVWCGEQGCQGTVLFGSRAQPRRSGWKKSAKSNPGKLGRRNQPKTRKSRTKHSTGSRPRPAIEPHRSSKQASCVLLPPCAGVFGNDARETGIPVEVWRYYLLAMRPENQDTGQLAFIVSYELGIACRL